MALKNELEHSNQVMSGDMLETIALLEKKCQNKQRDIEDLDRKAVSFRDEFTRMLEERNFFESESNLLSSKYELAQSELDAMRRSQVEWTKTYCDILGIRPVSDFDKSIEDAMRVMAEERHRYQDDYS